MGAHLTMHSSEPAVPSLPNLTSVAALPAVPSLTGVSSSLSAIPHSLSAIVPPPPSPHINSNVPSIITSSMNVIYSDEGLCESLQQQQRSAMEYPSPEREEDNEHDASSGYPDNTSRHAPGYHDYCTSEEEGLQWRQQTWGAGESLSWFQWVQRLEQSTVTWSCDVTWMRRHVSE